jgi:ABC-2 type transport system ATP-binding protein
MTDTTPSTDDVVIEAAPPAEAPAVRAQDLCLAYGAQRVLDGLSLSLQPGQVLGLLGRNGAGKTTLLESLLGLRELDSGSVELFGQQLRGMDDALRARVGFVPQRADLFDWLTPRQLLAYFRSFYPRWNEAKAQGLLSRWQISADLPIAKLSGGEQQRLSIVRALAPEPELLVLDEPVSSLDPAARRDFLRELVEQVLDRGSSVLFSSHILSDLERVAVDAAFMAGGRIVLQAGLDELLEHGRRLVGPTAVLEAWLAASGQQPLALRRLEGGNAQLLLGTLPALPVPAALAVEPVTLEQLFLELTR